jgi:anti-sigma factor RsiW
MAHFAEEVWADYVRGLAANDAAQKVSAHLADNCVDCKKASAAWERVRTIALREAQYQAPQDLVRLAKLQFIVDAPQPEDSWAGLVFDTAMQPAAAGIRGGLIHARQVIYEAESLTVDLRFERKLSGNAISVAGQVLDRQEPLSWVSEAVVVLWTDKGRMISKSGVNEYGEFQLEFEPQNQLRMSVITRGRKTLRIGLGSFD